MAYFKIDINRAAIKFNANYFECGCILHDLGTINASTKDRVVGVVCFLPTVNSDQSVSHGEMALVTTICRRKVSIAVTCSLNNAQPTIPFVDLSILSLSSTLFCKLQEKSMPQIHSSPPRQQNGGAFPTSSTASYPNVGMATPRRD